MELAVPTVLNKSNTCPYWIFSTVAGCVPFCPHSEIGCHCAVFQRCLISCQPVYLLHISPCVSVSVSVSGVSPGSLYLSTDREDPWRHLDSCLFND